MIDVDGGTLDRTAGALTAEEVDTLALLRRQSANAVSEIGQLEVRKARMLTGLGQLEARGEALLKGIAARLGIPDGQGWQVTEDGKARLIG